MPSLIFKSKMWTVRLLTLADYKAQKGLIVVFTSNHCPFSKAYEDRLMALERRFAPQGYPVLAIMPNDPVAYPEDSFENMKLRARDKAYPFAYTMDETQAVARAVRSHADPAGLRVEANEGAVRARIRGQYRRQPAGQRERTTPVRRRSGEQSIG